MNIPVSSKPRVVIVGGGFGGLRLAKGLNNGSFQVVLIDRQNYHSFQPLLYQVATAGMEPGSIAYPLRKIINRFKDYYFRMADLLEVRPQDRKILTSIGELSYDYLVLATGATSNFFGLKNVEAYAMPMKTLSQALDIRSLLLQNLEKALLSSGLPERESLMSVVIVGGGPTGVELAGALAELRKDILPTDYPDLDMRTMHIHLVDANERLLSEMTEKSSAFALKELTRMGVQVWFNSRVSDYDGNTITTREGKQLTGSMLIWAAGVKAVIPAGLPEDSIEKGRVLVNEYNAVQNQSSIFAIGDMARMSTAEYPAGHPMMAQPAMQQGEWLAKNLIALNRGGVMSPFRYKNHGSMATIGRAEAVTELPRLRLHGWIAWIAWLLVHVFQLIGFRNKLVVMINWAQNYFRHSRDLRLIIRPFQRGGK